jgi:hypothetical protein
VANFCLIFDFQNLRATLSKQSEWIETRKRTMMESTNTSYILDDKPSSTTSKAVNNVKLNETLQTQYIDLDDVDVSPIANLTRRTTKAVGNVLTPRQILGLLRVLKAATLAFLALGFLATTMYIIVVQLVAVQSVRSVAGGTRDIILRIYALGLICLGVAIELDYSRFIKRLAILKGFLSRAFLYFLISQLTAPPPVKRILLSSEENPSESDNDVDDQSFTTYDDTEVMIPSSSIGFQRVTSFVLYVVLFPWWLILRFAHLHSVKGLLRTRLPSLWDALFRSFSSQGLLDDP